MFGDIVDAEESCACEVVHDAEGERAGEAFIGHGTLTEADAADEAFSREGGEDGVAEGNEGRCAADEAEIIFYGFTETQSGIDDDGCWVDSSGHCGVGAGLEECRDISDDVGVLRRFVVAIGVGIACRVDEAVHENDAAFFLGYQWQHVFVGGASGNIIDAICSGFEAGAGDAAAGGVDRDWKIGEAVARSADGGNDGDEAVDLLLRGHGIGAGACGLAAKIEDIGTIADCAENGIEGGFRSFAAAGGVKTVGREVDDGHDPGPIKHQRSAGRECPGVSHRRKRRSLIQLCLGSFASMSVMYF